MFKQFFTPKITDMGSGLSVSNVNKEASGQRDRADTSVVLPAHQLHMENIKMGSAEIEHQFREAYQFVRILGKGASAEVHLIRHKATNKEYAVKVIQQSNSMNDQKSMKTEVDVMKKLQHGNLLTMYELYQTSETVWMILELANGGDLMHGLASLKDYNERNIAKLFQQALLGIKYLHSKGIIHRDLKMDNLLFQTTSKKLPIDEDSVLAVEDIKVKIADFGLSALTAYKRNEANSNALKSMKLAKEMWGTVEYFAPEVYSKAYGFQVDIWSLGCILFEILTGSIAFPSREVKSSLSLFDFFLAFGDKNNKPKRDFEYNSNYRILSDEAKDLIKGMLKRNPKKRFDIDECLSHPWITGVGLENSKDYNLRELKDTKRIIRERSLRRFKRYDGLVKEMEREEKRNHLLQKLRIY